MTTGTIILLNGTSSSGKTSIALALQKMIDEPFHIAGIDTFVSMAPEGFFSLGLDSFEGDSNTRGVYYQQTEVGPPPVFKPVIGPLGWKLVRGMYRAIAAMALAGNNLVFDDVIIDLDVLKDILYAWQGVNVLFVGVHCPLDICEQRERDRGDRLIGFARSWFPLVHTHSIYDVEVDTAILNSEDCAKQIIHRLESTSPTAFAQLREKYLV